MEKTSHRPTHFSDSHGAVAPFPHYLHFSACGRGYPMSISSAVSFRGSRAHARAHALPRELIYPLFGDPGKGKLGSAEPSRAEAR